MVEYLLGNYLVEIGKITEEQLTNVIAKQDETRVKMGLLAVAEGMMTAEEADNVNRLQASMDKYYGDIAVERGYLSQQQLDRLLKKQGNAYLSFAQTLLNENLLQLSELEEILKDYQKKNGYTKSDMEDLKSDDPDRIIPLFLPVEAMEWQEYIGIMVRTMIRCVDRHIYIGKATVSNKHSVGEAAFQRFVSLTPPVNGCMELETGFADIDGGMDDIVRAFYKLEYEMNSGDILGAAGEILNCVDGLYVSALSMKDIHCQLLPPIEMPVPSELEEHTICSIPIWIGTKQVLFIIIGREES